jgi:hypothetical protein
LKKHHALSPVKDFLHTSVCVKRKSSEICHFPPWHRYCFFIYHLAVPSLIREAIMVDRILTILGMCVAFALVAEPAMAGRQLTVSLPEPTTMALFGLGVGGAYIARKLIGRK